MAKRYKKIKKPLLRKVHFQAFLFLIIYTILSKTIFIKSVTLSSVALSFFIPYVYGVVAGVIFLYLFNHEDFFHFMKDVEKKEEKKEKGLLKKYLHYGKILSTLIIATVGGPVFSALTIRFLLNRFWYKYLILAVGNIASTAMGVALAKGVIYVFI